MIFKHPFLALYFVCIVWFSIIEDRPFIVSDKCKYVHCILLCSLHTSGLYNRKHSQRADSTGGWVLIFFGIQNMIRIFSKIFLLLLARPCPYKNFRENKTERKMGKETDKQINAPRKHNLQERGYKIESNEHQNLSQNLIYYPTI